MKKVLITGVNGLVGTHLLKKCLNAGYKVIGVDLKKGKHLPTTGWEFIQEDLEPFRSIIIHFENIEDIKKFSELLNQRITHLTKSIWYPEATIEKVANKKYIDESK
jgi:nucleoside-diphosphate-sugar epimerase